MSVCPICNLRDDLEFGESPGVDVCSCSEPLTIQVPVDTLRQWAIRLGKMPDVQYNCDSREMARCCINEFMDRESEISQEIHSILGGSAPE